MTTSNASTPSEETWDEIVLLCFEQLARITGDPIATSRVLYMTLSTLREAEIVQHLRASQQEAEIAKALERLLSRGQTRLLQRALWRAGSKGSES
jgi:hypothetical protein